jgi:predicted glycoside hydrolase/deacetylase ChbG (UPF0249 family)
MCHTVNMAFERVAESGIPVSASVMVACPWYQEAVEILARHPEVSVGIHLTLNAEWKNYRWGPVAGWKTVPTLTDSSGYFFPSRATFFANKPVLYEIEIELRAQIDRALRSGLRIDYLDYHMGTAVDRPELFDLVRRLAEEYHLGISRCFGEKDLGGYYAAAPEGKADSLFAGLSGVKEGEVRLMVFHVGMISPEMDALTDLNTTGLKEMSHHRQAELDMLTSHAFRTALESLGIRPITYRELIERIGLGNADCPDSFR